MPAPPTSAGSRANRKRRLGNAAAAAGRAALEGSRCCELCGAAAARVRCEGCRLTYYCDVAHQKADWVSIHERICQLLIPIRTSVPFLLSEKERKHGTEQLVKRQVVSGPGALVTGSLLRSFLGASRRRKSERDGICADKSPAWFQGKTAGRQGWWRRESHSLIGVHAQKYIIDLAYSTAREFVWDGKHQEAIPAALHALRFSTEVYGSNSVQLVPAYLLLAEASTGVGRLPEASKYLSQAQWIVLTTPGCGAAVQCKLHRSLGLFCTAEGNFEQALYHLANDIYLASSTFGLKSVEASGGYFHMANVFFRQNKMDIANSLYAEVTDIWRAFLLKSVQAQERILESRPEMSPFAGDEEVGEDRMTEAQRAEAIRVLSAVLDVREQAPKQRPGETAGVLHALAMLYYLTGDLPKAREAGLRAFHLLKPLPRQESLETIGHLLELINSQLSCSK